MRIELNAGGLDGFSAIVEFALGVDALDEDIDSVISSFQSVKNAVSNLEGGIGNLGGAVESLRKRIYNEESKKHNLIDMGRRFDDFLTLAINMDKDAAELVRKNKEEFYQMNEHLRPVVVEEEKKSLLDKFLDTLVSAGEFIVETLVECADEIFVIGATVVTVVGGVLLIGFTIITGGTGALLIAGFAVLGAGIGMGVAGWKSYQGDGDVDLVEVFKGGLFGAVAGAAVGATLFAAGQIAASFSGVGGFIASEFVQGAGTGVALDFFNQTVMEGETVLGFEDYDFARTVYEGFKGGAVSALVGSVMKFTGFTSKLSEGMGKILNIDSKFLKHIVANMPGNAIKGGIESLTGLGIDVAFGMDDGSYSIETLLLDMAFSTGFGAVSDGLNFKAQQFEIKTRVMENIEKSRIARESSHFGEAPLSIEKQRIRSQTRVRVMENIEASKIARASSNFDRYLKILDGAPAPTPMSLMKNIKIGTSSLFGRATGEADFSGLFISQKDIPEGLFGKGLRTIPRTSVPTLFLDKLTISMPSLPVFNLGPVSISGLGGGIGKNNRLFA